MTVNESKFIIQKLIKYSMEELEMAEHYQKMMAHMEDSSAFSKFKEFANQELAHHEYDLSTAMAMAQKLKDENEIADVDEFIMVFISRIRHIGRKRLFGKLQTQSQKPLVK